MEEEWTVSANDAVNISLVRPGPAGLEKFETFNPKFTYAIFGQEETIFGYKGLKINLQYDARDLRPNLSVSSIKKFAAIGGIEPHDAKETMKEYLPGVAFQTRQEYERAVKALPDTWKPPGKLVKSVEKNGETFEIYQGSMADEAVKQLVKRIQVVVLFFIEGGSYIGEDADGKEEPEYSLARWSVFFVYKKQAHPTAPEKSQYTFQGYSTLYNFWMYQPPTPPASPKVGAKWELPQGDFSLDNVPHRARISQFIILPPYQGKGIGALLYNTIFELRSEPEAVKEVTVEDPNEDFDLLRDLCDMKYLRSTVPEFADLKVNTNVSVPQKGGILYHNTRISVSGLSSSSSASGIVDMEALEKLRTKAKIAPRQFWRLVEMHLMSKLPATVRPQPDPDAKKPTPSKADKHAYTLWRLLLKQRLYRRNVSLLGEMAPTERILKLNETVENVEWEYARILERLESTPTSTTTTSNGKRKLDGDDEEASPAGKKARTEEAAETASGT
ncbi:histone acetyl transferase HAT1-like protein [Xylariomycetidae sp. FL2044]|nr:histone acetyl transferase HAT1-like protein [Xylariomycetidae sp. FL2044]